MTRVDSLDSPDSPVPLMHHDPDRSWITDPNSDHPKGTHSPVPLMHYDPDRSWITDPNSDHPKGTHPNCYMSRSTKTPKGIQVPGSFSFKKLLKEAWKIASSIFKRRLNLVMKSTLEEEKTARVHRLFGASKYVNRADKAEKFWGNSSTFKWKNRKISSSKRAKYYGH